MSLAVESAEPEQDLEATARGPRPDNRTVFGWALVAALAALLVYVSALLFYSLRGLLVQVAVAAFIAVSLDPAVRWLIAHRIKRSRAVAIVLATVTLAVAGFMYATIPTLAGEANKLGSDFPGFLDDLLHRSPSLRHLVDRFDLQPKIVSFARTAPTWLSHQWLGLSKQFFGALLSTLLVVVLTIYFMADLPRLRRGIVRLFPRRHRHHVQHATTVVIEKVGAYMIGNLIISLIAGVTSLIAMLSLRVPFALPLAVAVAITDLIPLIGATLGAAICVIVAFATTDLWPNTILLLIFFVLYQQAENYLIAPRVLRHAVELPAVAVLLVALIGGTILGLVGALMAVPIAAAVRVIVTPMLAARDEEHAAELEGP